MRVILGTLAAAFLVILAGAISFVVSGFYDVSATAARWPNHGASSHSLDQGKPPGMIGQEYSRLVLASLTRGVTAGTGGERQGDQP
jgi:hypothetical protein